MTETSIIAEFVRQHPGCTPADIAVELRCDEETAWLHIVEAELQRVVRRVQDGDGPVHFEARDPNADELV